MFWCFAIMCERPHLFLVSYNSAKKKHHKLHHHKPLVSCNTLLSHAIHNVNGNAFGFLLHLKSQTYIYKYICIILAVVFVVELGVVWLHPPIAVDDVVALK